MEPKQIEGELLNVLRLVGERLPEKDVQSIRELVQAGEWGIGFENLCDQLYEYNVKISEAVFNRLDMLAKVMEIDESRWSFVSDLVI